MQAKIVLLFSLHLLVFSQIDPPVWPQEFRQAFVEGFKGTQVHVIGDMFYSATKNMSRLTRSDGRFEAFCGTNMPNVTTPCTQLVREGKRYVIYPQKQVCCICCVASHGCGILRRDWLKTAKYEGKQTLQDREFNKWSIPDGDDMDYYWTTTDDKNIPRKMDEGGNRIKDFIMNTYSEDAIPEEVFRLPSYCSDKMCPSTSACGKFQTPIVQDE